MRSREETECSDDVGCGRRYAQLRSGVGGQLDVVVIAAEVGVKGGMCIYVKPGRQRDEGCENDDDALR